MCGFEVVSSTSDFSRIFPFGEAGRTPAGRMILCMVLQGSSLVEIDGRKQLLQCGSFVYLNPNHLVEKLSQTHDFLFAYMTVEFDFLSDFPLLVKAEISEYVGNNPYLSLKADDFLMLRKYFDLIADRYEANREHIEIVKGLLFSFVQEVCRLYCDGKDSEKRQYREYELADRFFFLLHVHYREKRSVAFYADSLCVSDKYLMRLVKKATGKTVHYWTTDFIIREAKLQLRSSGKSVTEISDDLHFPNSSFFARFFRRNVGLSPLDFRRQS